MISPKHINFNDNVQALLSYEKARFAPYDLDEAEAEPVVIESNETFDLLEVKLKLANGEEVIRHVKAYKNGESEVIDPEEPTTKPVTSYSVSGPDMVVRGSSEQYQVTIVPEDATVETLIWETDNGEITADGLYTPATKGAASVMVKINGMAREMKSVNVLPFIPEAEVQPVAYNVPPDEHALNEKGNFLTGSGFTGVYATTVNDKVIELALAPAKAGLAILGPSVDGVYPTADGEVSVTFAVTALGDAEVDLFNDYDIKLLAEATEVMSLVDGVWVGVNKPDYILTDSVKNTVTIQNTTRQRYLAEAGFIEATTDEEIWQLTATHKTTGATLEAMISVPKNLPVQIKTMSGLPLEDSKGNAILITGG